MRTCRRAIPALLCLPLLAGCVETRVVKYNPFLGGLPGAESGTPVIRDLGPANALESYAEDQLVQQGPDGKPRLVIRTGRHLILQIYNTIEDQQKDLFIDQVLSKLTRAECAARGEEPGALYDQLCADRLDVYDLFNIMPLAERTPGAIISPQGKGVQRVSMSGLGTSNLRYRAMDMVMEGGNWRLRWFVE